MNWLVGEYVGHLVCGWVFQMVVNQTLGLLIISLVDRLVSLSVCMWVGGCTFA